MNKENKENKQLYKVEICEITGKKVIKTKRQTEHNWLCLHNESEFLDQVAVEAFEAGQSF